MKIAVWDDDPEAAGKWKLELENVLKDTGGVSIDAPPPSEIEENLRIVHERRRVYLDSGEIDDERYDSGLDHTDILLVDNDLFELPQLKDHSAETVAARASLYTSCGFIVVLNLSPDLDFDLTLLRYPSSKADLHINDKFLADHGLWHECPKESGDFRPWHWPLLLRAASMYRSRVAELTQAFKEGSGSKPILDYFSFSDWARRRLSRTARAFLHPEIPAQQVSFWRFIEDNANAVYVRDGARIVERKDVNKLAQVCARSLAKWLERYVLGPQDILLDFPHLVEKMPFVVPEAEQGNVDFWNSCAKLEGAPVELIESYGIARFERSMWFDRPVFWADGIESEDNLNRLFAATDTNPCELVFCEDSSSFHRAEECEQFVAAHNTVSDRRFVRWFGRESEELRYGPQSRFAL